MPKWKHLHLQAGGVSGFSSVKFHPRFAKEQEIANWKKIPLYEYLNQLGEQGWEIITHAFRGIMELHFVLKRIKP